MRANHQDSEAEAQQPQVLRLSHCERARLSALLCRFGLTIEVIRDDDDIPGSFWGDEEAGLVGNRLLARSVTPVHSILHEAGHYVCMSAERRDGLHTDAGGGYDEENAVCYLQILLADELPEMGRDRMFNDMDAWGYSFRLGSAQRWFESDADDAMRWLRNHQLIDGSNQPTWNLRA